MADDQAQALCHFKECDPGAEPVDTVPPGYGLVMADKVLQARKDEWPGTRIQEGIWLSLSDLTDAVCYTTLTRRLSGCCGPSGIDGPNRICTCGAEVGTESSDCWTLRNFVSETKNTEWKEQE
ncbi:hypothetical protein [Pseudaestuariivita rosea]|uniref:hypothetical protein n=1 Tax=Pseudaestuariivita rosea TaxID=2763263 RepID=UPI001ABB765A|nr:hypothetical protein [Pseudaestuariivita rosea]